ncbi:hypothetical protein MRX96_039328 [Rhipicephalus microplus]
MAPRIRARPAKDDVGLPTVRATHNHNGASRPALQDEAPRLAARPEAPIWVRHLAAKAFLRLFFSTQRKEADGIEKA